VGPLGIHHDRRSGRRAGLAYAELAEVREHESFAACLKSLGSVQKFSVETSGARLYSDARFSPGDALVFGSERRGLPPQVLEQIERERQLVVPMRAGNRSLNLSNAVALVVYEAWRQNGFAGRGELARDASDT